MGQKLNRGCDLSEKQEWSFPSVTSEVGLALPQAAEVLVYLLRETKAPGLSKQDTVFFFFFILVWFGF